MNVMKGMSQGRKGLELFFFPKKKIMNTQEDIQKIYIYILFLNSCMMYVSNESDRMGKEKKISNLHIVPFDSVIIFSKNSISDNTLLKFTVTSNQCFTLQFNFVSTRMNYEHLAFPLLKIHRVSLQQNPPSHIINHICLCVHRACGSNFMCLFLFGCISWSYPQLLCQENPTLWSIHSCSTRHFHQFPMCVQTSRVGSYQFAISFNGLHVLLCQASQSRTYRSVYLILRILALSITYSYNLPLGVLLLIYIHYFSSYYLLIQDF